MAQILNKPTIPAEQVNADWNAESDVAQILNKPTLATVATSGSYNDLSNKPTIPQASDDYPSYSAPIPSPGRSPTYSRSDHVHGRDSEVLDAIADIRAKITEMRQMMETMKQPA